MTFRERTHSIASSQGKIRNTTSSNLLPRTRCKVWEKLVTIFKEHSFGGTCFEDTAIENLASVEKNSVYV